MVIEMVKSISIGKMPYVLSNIVRTYIVISLDEGSFSYVELYERVLENLKNDHSYWYKISNKTFAKEIDELCEAGVIEYDGRLYSIKTSPLISIGERIVDVVFSPIKHLTSFYQRLRE